MPYKITDQREQIKEAIKHGYRDVTDVDRFGFVLKHWDSAFGEDEQCSTRTCFPSKESAEEYVILLRLYGRC